jgi:hypothetical protein
MMTREIHSKSTIEGFTPASDVLVERYSSTTAMVFGAVWRYCQMKDGVCYAALDKIAARAGYSYSTTLRHIKLLCEEGYLFDQNPGLRNGPHTYRLTGKLDVEQETVTRMTENPSSVRGIDESDKPPSSVTVIDDPSSVKFTDPSSVTVIDPSSVTVTDEQTLREGLRQHGADDSSPLNDNGSHHVVGDELVRIRGTK